MNPGFGKPGRRVAAASNQSAISRWGLAVAFLLAIGITSPVDTARAQRADTITRTDGSTVRAKISKVAPTGIEGVISGKTQQVSADVIASIAFGDEPSSMRQARSAIEDGQWDQAEQALGRTELTASDREAVRQEYQYLRAQLAAGKARQGQESVSNATSEMVRFLKNNRSSFHYFPAIQELGDLAMQAGDFEKAARYYGQLGKAPWAGVKLQAAVLEGNALRSQGKSKYPDAMKRFDAVLSRQVSDPELRRQQSLAIVGRAACMAEMGQSEEALRQLELIIQKNDAQDVELFAKAYNAKGACYRAIGRNQDAILEYLKVDLVFFRETAAHAEALYWLSQLETREGRPARADRARTLLKTRYGTSVWAGRAG